MAKSKLIKELMQEGQEAVDSLMDMAKAARMKRAREMGFDTDTVWYHATDTDFDEFDTQDFGSWFAEDVETAGIYGDTGDGAQRIMPVHLAPKKTLVVPRDFDLSDDQNLVDMLDAINEANGTNFKMDDFYPGGAGPDDVEGGFMLVGQNDYLEKNLREAGFDSVEAWEQGERTMAMLEPEGIRSINAAFDPAKKDSANLLASMAGAGVVGSGLYSEDADAVPITKAGKKIIEAWHGSPHKFDKFSMDKIGTGEGAQAYGHGLYFADRRGIAKSYRENLTQRGTGDFGDVMSDEVLSYQAFEGGPYDDATKEIQEIMMESIQDENPNVPEYVARQISEDFAFEMGGYFGDANQAATEFFKAGGWGGADETAVNKAMDAMSNAYSEFGRSTLDWSHSKWLEAEDGASFFDAFDGAATIGERQAKDPIGDRLYALLTDPDRPYDNIDDLIDGMEEMKETLPGIFKNQFPEGIDAYVSKLEEWKSKGAKLRSMDEFTSGSEGGLYRVHLDVEPDMLLDYDAALHRQPDKVKQALRAAGIDVPEGPVTDEMAAAKIQETIEKLKPALRNLHYKDSYTTPGWFKGDVKKVKRVAKDIEAALKNGDLERANWLMEVMEEFSDRILVNSQPDYLVDNDSFMEAAGAISSFAEDAKVKQETGADLLARLGKEMGGPAGASAVLREAGIPGLRYSDAMSRNRAGGTYNYVMFDDTPISIQERGFADPRLLAGTAAGAGLYAANTEGALATAEQAREQTGATALMNLIEMADYPLRSALAGGRLLAGAGSEDAQRAAQGIMAADSSETLDEWARAVQDRLNAAGYEEISPYVATGIYALPQILSPL